MTAVLCSGCARAADADDAFCRGCGTRLNQAPAAQSPLVGERRQLTVMFCDLVGSTRMAAGMDPEDVQTVLRRYQEAATQIVGNVEGYVAQYLGDGILVYFGYPVAHEDDPLRAVTASLDIAHAVPQLSAQLRREVPSLVEDLSVRIGIHTGSVVVGSVGSVQRRETLASGPAVNQAARLAAAAQADTVVISDVTAGRVAGVFVLADLGTLELKGIADPVHSHRVVRIKGTQSRFAGRAVGSGLPMVGRADIVAELLSAWVRAGQGGAEMVVLRGEAGIGKSRLLQALRQRLAPEPHGWIACYGSALQQSDAFSPIAAAARAMLGLDDEGMTEAQKQDRLKSALGVVGLEDEQILDGIGRLLAVFGSTGGVLSVDDRAAALAAMSRWWLLLAQIQPMVLALEDVHLYDPSSIDFVDTVLRSNTGEPLLVLATMRGEIEVPWCVDRLTVIDVPPLGPKEIAEIVRQVLAGRAVGKAGMAALVDRSDGVPLYAEELARDLGDQADGLLDHAIPASLQDSFTSRLDRLGSRKRFAQIGALLGREFSHELLAALVDVRAGLVKSALDELVMRQILHRDGIGPRATYTFRHALLQDVAADSMLRQHRRDEHHRIADVIVNRFPGDADERPALVAHHYAESGDALSALNWYALAGARAAARAELREAVSAYDKAIELLNALEAGEERDQRELDLRLDACVPRSMSTSYGDPEVRESYRRTNELCLALPGGSPRQFESLFGLARSAMVASDLDVAAAASEELRAFGDVTGDPVAALAAEISLGQVRYWQGHFTLSVQHCARADSLAGGLEGTPEEGGLRTVGLVHPRVISRTFASWARWALGAPVESVAAADDAMAFARTVGHPYSLGFACSFAGVNAIMLRDRDRAERCALEANEIAERHGLQLVLGQATTILGWVEIERGVSAGLAKVQKGMDVLAAAGSGSGAPGFLAVLAECLGRTGQHQASLGTAQFGLALAAEKGQRFYDAELLRLVGLAQAHLEGVNSAAAEGSLRASLELAREQDGRSFAVRTAVTLARMLLERGDHVGVARDLGLALGRIGDDQDSVELKEARVLLARLCI